MASVILLADDSPTIQKVLRLALSDSPYDLEVVNNGLDVLKSVDKYRPNLILADVLLPGMDGYQVCEEIKRRFNIPIVLIYGAFENIDENRLKKIGADGSLKKPFATQELFKLIRQLTSDNQLFQKQERSPSLQEHKVGSSELEELIYREFPEPVENNPTIERNKKEKDEIDISYLDEELIVPPKSEIFEDTVTIPPMTTDVKSLDEKQIQEIAKDVIEKVAWEVIPRIAENIIREEIQKLLDKVEKVE